MPELPEVETTRRGIAVVAEGQIVRSVVTRTIKLRRPLQVDLHQKLANRKILSLERRAKYLLFRFEHGTLLIHLGMSGHLRIVPAGTPHDRHDHVDIQLENNSVIRFHDPRKFGLVLFVDNPADDHGLLSQLGSEPLSDGFTGQHLLRTSRHRKLPVKAFIMDQKIVVGVGNIYASESLFRAGINPARPAGNVSLARYCRLTDEIKAVLTEAIAAGGTTLRDFLDGSARPGYFKNSLLVYRRSGQPCLRCETLIKSVRLGQRSTFYCPHCQRL